MTPTESPSSETDDIPYHATIAVLGPENSFSHQAGELIRHERQDVQLILQNTMQEIWKLIDTEHVLGLLPRINYSSHSVQGNLDRLFDRAWHIIGEVMLNVRMCLGGVEGTTLEDIREVLSQPTGLDQCYQYLQNNLLDAKLRGVSSTAAAAEEVKQRQDKSVAALASEDAMRSRNLQVLARGISNAELIGEINYTHFVLVERNGDTPPEPDPQKRFQALILTPENRQGIAADIANIFRAGKVDLFTQTEAPIGPMKYRFLYGGENKGTPQDVLDVYARLGELRPLNGRFPLIKHLGSWNTRIWDPS